MYARNGKRGSTQFRPELTQFGEAERSSDFKGYWGAWRGTRLQMGYGECALVIAAQLADRL